MIKLQCPPNRFGDFICNAVGQSGTTYRDVVAGSVIEVDPRDLPFFSSLGFLHVALATTTTTTTTLS